MPTAAANRGSSRAGHPAGPSVHDVPRPPKKTVGRTKPTARAEPIPANTRKLSPTFGYGTSVTMRADATRAPPITTSGAALTKFQSAPPAVGPKRRGQGEPDRVRDGVGESTPIVPCPEASRGPPVEPVEERRQEDEERGRGEPAVRDVRHRKEPGDGIPERDRVRRVLPTEPGHARPPRPSSRPPGPSPRPAPRGARPPAARARPGSRTGSSRCAAPSAPDPPHRR